MPDHDLALYTLGLLVLVLLALASYIEFRRDRREEEEFERAYDRSRSSIERVERLLGESEAAAILDAHDRRFTEVK